MTRVRERWFGAFDEDLFAGTNIIVPSLMGAGIVMSLAILLGDIAHRLRPGARVGQTAAAGRRAAELVAPIAEAIGEAPPELPRIRRPLRRRRFYLVLLFVMGVLGLYILVGSITNYLTPGLPGSGEDLFLVAGVLTALAFLGVAAASFAISYGFPVIPRWVEPLIDHSVLGVVPQVDTHARRSRQGDEPPDFCLRDGDNNTVCGRDLFGRRPVIVWIHHGRWCLACARGLEDLDRAVATEAPNVGILALSPDTLEEARRFRDGRNLALTSLSDPTLSAARRLGFADEGGVRPGAIVVDERAAVTCVVESSGHVPAVGLVVAAARSEPKRMQVMTPSDVMTPSITALAVIVLTILGMLAIFADQSLLFWDRPLRSAIRAVGDTAFAGAMDVVTELGSRRLIGLLTIVASALAWRRCPQLALTLPGLFVGGLAVELILKALVDRPRPMADAGFGASMPSGHVIAATAFWGLMPPLIYLLTRSRWAWAATSVAVGLILLGVGVSRVYLSAHWPSDVVAGYLSGAVLLLVAEWAIRRPWPRAGCDRCDLHPITSD